MKKLRQSTVEPVLGTLIRFLSMRRVTTRGVKLANKCRLRAAVCYNLKRLPKWRGEEEKESRMVRLQLNSILRPLRVLHTRHAQLAAVAIHKNAG